ncbi:MAG: diguanylate cyclase [Aquabacterium sp.]
MGPIGPVRDGVRRLVLTLPSYLFIAVLLLACAGLGFVQPWQTAAVLGYNVAGIGAFYVLVRTGMAQALAKDPSLAFQRVMFNASMVMLAYALIPLARGLALQWLCMTILFDMRRLSALQVRVVAASAYAMLIGVVLLILEVSPSSIDRDAEFVNVAMASVTLCVLLVVTHIGQGISQHRKAQKVELERTVAKLNALSVRDGLTQLYNRRHFQTLLDEEVRRSHRCRRPFCVAILDIDFFKRVNDQHGHATGDVVLREVSRLLQNAIGPTHALARWGGEEFLLLMPETALADALNTLEAVGRAVREHDWADHAPGLRVTLSAGACQHGQGLNLTPTLELADRALYQAKHGGRDQVVAVTA